jgi:hypothetical protein
MHSTPPIWPISEPEPARFGFLFGIYPLKSPLSAADIEGISGSGMEMI